MPPNLAFALLISIHRAGFEAFWLRAFFRNKARQDWLDQAVAQAQRPLRVLGVGYCLPLNGSSLAGVVEAGVPLTRAQQTRAASGLVVHNRFDDDAITVVDISADTADEEADEDIALANSETTAVATVVLKLAEALLPLAEPLQSLSQYGPDYAPAVRVLADPSASALRLQQVREALRMAGLPVLECEAIDADTGLMVADTWLDALERRPLLVIAMAWHDATPAPGSGEGCVAVLLDPGYYRLPDGLAAYGALHRPVSGDASALEDLLRLALLWGAADAPAVNRAWLTGLGSQHDLTLHKAWTDASLEHLADAASQRRPDRVVGAAVPLNPWLSVAAAIEQGAAGPQLIVDGAQAAVLHVIPSSNDRSDP
ncbi:hypothetical protein [Cupriavidus agavae]|uniref:hypothetical protein n=1 Tax=Cupriavidus agavae TaxID=1001822 RepID=UPI001F243706|nr:hypothetical protein [Cupriavidus agavae]